MFNTIHNYDAQCSMKLACKKHECHAHIHVGVFSTLVYTGIYIGSNCIGHIELKFYINYWQMLKSPIYAL